MGCFVYKYPDTRRKHRRVDRRQRQMWIRHRGAPEDKVLDTIARAAICLTDAGFPLLAQDAAWMLGMRDGGDVIGAVAMSLRFGAEGRSKN